MANTSRINGFRPTRKPDGTYPALRWYSVPASDGTALYVGDPVKLAGDADAASGGKPTVTQAAAGNAIVGIIVGFDVNRSNINIDGQYRVASTARDVLVCDDPNAVFEVETSNGTLTTADVGLNVNHALGSPSTTMARSGATADSGTKATTATLTFKILQFSERIDNDDTAASAKILVKVNNHQFGSGTGTAGV
jgi:hypothetical protein